MSSPISFVKNTGDDYTNPSNQDRITNDIWFTRLNTGGPLFNYKYYLDNSIIPTKGILQNDFYYDIPNSQGGTIGVKWAILSTTGFPDVNAPGINPALFGKIGHPTNFFSFSQMCVLLSGMLNESSKPIYLTDINNSCEWTLEDNSTIEYPNNMPDIENKDLACYIPSINKYFKIKIGYWGVGDDGQLGAISYTRTEILSPSQTSVIKGNFNFGLFSRTKGGNNKIVAATFNLGCTKGRGSSTRIFNYCNKRENYGFCLNQFTTQR